MIAGKGHETGQEFADRTIPFDDRIVARELLARARLWEAGRVTNILLAGFVGLVVSLLGTPVAIRTVPSPRLGSADP